jgi:hypothetical protein
MLLWVYAGPLRGRFLELPLEDALKAIDDDWAETTEGRINHSNPFRAVSKELNVDAERYAAGKPGKRSEPPPEEPPPENKDDKAAPPDGKAPRTYDDRELTSDRERQQPPRRRQRPASL